MMKVSSNKPLVAIVGRANVGKSTLFNRILGRKKAITADLSGVTRDLNYADIEDAEQPFTLVDTGGFEVEPEGIMNDVRLQAQLAIEEADVILFLMDGKAGLGHGDREIAATLRKAGKPVIYVVNKIDSPSRDELLAEFYSLGVETIIGVSAEHGLNIPELVDALDAALPPSAPESHDIKRTALSIVGRPNVGKSSILNRLIGRPRSIVSDMAGTTRDSIDTPVRVNESDYLFIDTAGIRKKHKISLTVESYCVVEAIRSMERSDITLLVLDGKAGLKTQDERIAGIIEDRKKPCIIVVNKWDIVEKDTNTAKETEEGIRERLPFIYYAPVVFVSALTGQRTDRILPLAEDVLAEAGKKITTSRLNSALREITGAHRPPLYRNKAVKFYYATQLGSAPPAFIIFVNKPEGIADSYKRYLTKSLRAALELNQVPLRIVFRRRH
ncbi:MAG: ribosome biogenesis GTPase Der [Thermodesulfobacteriota bacterium]